MGVGSSSTEQFDESDKSCVTNIVSTAFSTSLSDMYVACKQNQLDDVRNRLETSSLADINRIEPHGSTALHAAAYYGHTEIVKLLLEKGAVRTIHNSYNCTPYEEAKTPEIRQLFARTPHTKRFGGLSGSIEWNVIDPTAAKSVSEYKETEKNWFNDVCADDNALYLKEIQRYVRKKLANVEKMDQIDYLIGKAIEEGNILLILKVYTLQTGFYNALNVELASNNSVTYAENDTTTHDAYFRYWHGPGGYAALIAHHPAFAQYSFTGISYRGMLMLDTDIKLYKVNTFVINKAFLSTSTDRKIAKTFAVADSSQRKDGDNIVKYPTMCTYKTQNHGTAFDISSISEYPTEKEVLIMPRTAFRVAAIKHKRSITRQAMILIELHECNPEKYDDIPSSINMDDPYY
jgi:hypothetical protein